MSEFYATESKKRVQARYLRRGFAFSEAGNYFIKAALYDQGYKNKIESQPIEIRINEPRTIDDVRVWDELKSNPEYAYFLQTGGLRDHPVSAKTKEMVENLEQIIKIYPRSRYVVEIRGSLSKYRSSLENLKKRGVIKPE